MALNANQLVTQSRTFLRGLTTRQRLVLGLSALVVVLTLWLFVRLSGKTEFRTLYSNLPPQEAQAIAEQLSAQKIAFELSRDRSALSVPAGQLDQARLAMASHGFPQRGRLGFELFDKPNWGGSEFAEKVNYQRALEGELERTISSMEEVEATRIHLVLPRESLFTEREREAKAAVVLKLRGRRLSDQALGSITHLVASAVDNLKPENVTVVDANGQVPLRTQNRNGAPGLRDIAEYESALADKIVATLAPVIGANQVRVSVAVDQEESTSESTVETYDPNATAVLSTQITEERFGGLLPEGIPGTPSNVPSARQEGSPSGLGAASAETQASRSESRTYAVSKVLKRTMQPAGVVRRVSAAVLVDDVVEMKTENGRQAESRRKRTPEELKQIEGLAAAAIGIDPWRGDRLTVENISFRTLPVEEVKPVGLSERMAPWLERWISLVRYGFLVLLFALIYWLVLRPVRRQMVMTFRALPARLTGPQPAPALAEAGAPSLGAGHGESALSSLPSELKLTNQEAQDALNLKRVLTEKVKSEPRTASRLVQNWLRETTRVRK